MTSKIQNALIILGIIAIAGIGFYLYTQKDDISLNNNEVDNQAAADTSDFLQRLNDLKTIKLKGEIFNDPRFMSLVDLSSPSRPIPQGRENPFAPNN